MEMPNTVPNATTQELLEDKYVIASKNSIANYSFFMGATNDNLDEVLKKEKELSNNILRAFQVSDAVINSWQLVNLLAKDIKANGGDIGNSIFEAEMIEWSRKVYTEYSDKIVLPVDHLVSESIEKTNSCAFCDILIVCPL